jgi:hypothetical protein
MLGIPRGAAEWVKRGPCGRLESAQVILGEDGVRSFLDTAGPSAATGSLVVPGPAGWLAFSRDLAPAQWRAARLALKREALGANVSRTLQRLTTQAPASGDAGACDQVLLVGGVAGDGELLRSLHAAVDAVLPGALVGRGDVGSGQGALGHRWAVAYGLTLLRG